MLHAGEGGPVRASKARRNFGVRAQRETRKPQGIVSTGPGRTWGPGRSVRGLDCYVRIFPSFWRRLRKKDWPS
jgi:hypothetical protein